MTRDPDESVRQASETAMREIVGKQTMDFVLYEGRTTVASQVQALMQQILDRYQTGIQVSTVAIQNAAARAGAGRVRRRRQGWPDRERQINEGQAYANQVAAGQRSGLAHAGAGRGLQGQGDRRCAG